MRRSRSRIESRIEGAVFLEVRAPARKGKQRIEFQPFASPAQNLRQQLPFQKRAAHSFGVGFGQRRPADRQPRLLQRIAKRRDARRATDLVLRTPVPHRQDQKGKATCRESGCEERWIKEGARSSK